mgnify:CR=1 FL=1
MSDINKNTLVDMMVASIEQYKNGDIDIEELKNDIHWYRYHMDRLIANGGTSIS